MHFRSTLLFALSLIVLLAACVPSPKGTAMPTSVKEATPVFVTLTPDPTRYYNPQGKFSLKLPEGWKTLGPLTVDNDPGRPFDLYILGPDPMSDGGPGTSKIIIADAKQWTVEQFVQMQCSTCAANPVDDVMLGSKPAQRTQVGGGGVPFMITWYFVENNGKLLALSIHDPETLEPLEEVIQSIQFE